MEALLPDAYLKRVGESFLVPHFRNSDYDAGVIAAMQAIKQSLLAPDSVKELDSILKRNNSFWFKHAELLNKTGIILLIVLIVYLYLGWITKSLSGRVKIKRDSILSSAVAGVSEY